MKPGELEVNDLVMVRSLEDSSARAYPSRVEDRSEDKALLAWPTDGGVRIPIHKEDRLFVSFTRPDAVYGLETLVEKVLAEPIPLVGILLTGETQRIQRREYARVQALLPVEMIQASPIEEEDTGAIGHIHTNTLDISGGGMAIQHRQVISTGTLYDVRLSIPGQPPPLKMLAKVVRSTMLRDAHNKKIYKYGLMFISITEGILSRLVKYVFDVQRKSMNR
jgi:c-di-GMP-binding flagellar brake protein YcgR